MKIPCALKFVSFYTVTVLLLVVSASYVCRAQAHGTVSPEQVVNELQEALIQSMREGSALGYQGRFDLLAPVVDRSHDLDFIARTSLGTNWSELTTEQQRTFKDIFRKLSIATYAGWFKEHNGQFFEFLEKRTMPRDQVMVRSRLVQSDAEPVRFDYILREGKEGWRIVNILADGVSDLALKRVEYRAILQRDGFSKLIDMLREKIVQAEQE